MHKTFQNEPKIYIRLIDSPPPENMFYPASAVNTERSIELPVQGTKVFHRGLGPALGVVSDTISEWLRGTELRAGVRRQRDRSPAAILHSAAPPHFTFAQFQQVSTQASASD